MTKQGYSIPALAYDSRSNFPEDFLAANKVLICNYQVLFNGRSKFGVRDASRTPISLGAIILDDAHVAFSTIREQFTLRVKREEHPDNYSYLTNVFRSDFTTLGKVGTFDDIVSGVDNAILEVPYWSWQEKSSQIREFLRNLSEYYPLVWPLLRDNFDYCHCFISRNAFVITPIFPLVDLIPTFIDCPSRIFMSATISDDSAIIRTFDADYASVSKPITSNSLAGVSERMILAPELTADS